MNACRVFRRVLAVLTVAAISISGSAATVHAVGEATHAATFDTGLAPLAPVDPDMPVDPVVPVDSVGPVDPDETVDPVVLGDVLPDAPVEADPSPAGPDDGTDSVPVAALGAPEAPATAELPASAPAEQRVAVAGQSVAPTTSGIESTAADTLKVAWVDSVPHGAEPTTLLTLAQALAVTDSGQYVHIVPDSDLTFAKALVVNRSVTIVSSAETTVRALWSINADDVTFTDTANVALTGTSATGKTVVTVASGRSGVTINDVELTTTAASNSGISVAGTTNTTVNRASVTVGSTGGTGFNLDGTTNAALNSITFDAPGDDANYGITASSSATGIKVNGAVIKGVKVGFYMTKSTSEVGAQFTDVTVAARTNGFVMNASTAPRFTNVTVTHSGSVAGSVAVSLESSTGAELDNVNLSGFPHGIKSGQTSGQGVTLVNSTISASGTGAGPLGGTGIIVKDSTFVAEGATGSAVSLAQHSYEFDISDLTIQGFASGISSAALKEADANKTGGTVRNIVITDAKAGVSLNTFKGVTIENVSLVTTTPGGSGVHLHTTEDVTVTDITVDGTQGSSYSNGTNGIRSYFTTNLTIADVTIVGGSTGFYFDTTTGVTTTNASVSNMAWYGVYAEKVTDWTMSGSTFKDNVAVGNLTSNPTTPDNHEISNDVHWTGNTFEGHQAGVFLPLGFRGFEFDNNTVVAQNARYVIGAFPAHDVKVHDNNITFSPLDEKSAVMVVGHDTHSDRNDPGNFTSSNITIADNTFAGPGPVLRVGSTGGVKTALSGDPIRMVGNTFPFGSAAIDVRPNARAEGDDAVVVDARNHGNPNDWGAACGPTATRTVASEETSTEVTDYAGGGATTHQFDEGQVLHPTNCIDLSLTVPDFEPRNYEQGDIVTWSLAPSKEGLTDAPAGWTVTQLLSDGVELVSMSGEGYTFDGATATATDVLGKDQAGSPITVTVKVADPTWDDAQHAELVLRGVAYVAPLAPDYATDIDADGFVDVIAEVHNPLVVPGIDTDTVASLTNNDAEVSSSVVRADVLSSDAEATDSAGSPGATRSGVGREGVERSSSNPERESSNPVDADGRQHARPLDMGITGSNLGVLGAAAAALLVAGVCLAAVVRIRRNGTLR